MSRNEIDLRKTVAVIPHPSHEGEQLSLFSADALREIQKESVRWRREAHDPLRSKRGPWKKDFTTVSGMDSSSPMGPQSHVQNTAEASTAIGESPVLEPRGLGSIIWLMTSTMTTSQ